MRVGTEYLERYFYHFVFQEYDKLSFKQIIVFLLDFPARLTVVAGVT
ncbi:hypothetical protein NSP_11480 [Nodularia spumigena CCY9414]|nr:hypothetical protein NSP_11480 [Nodularia spumigena CCY9414]